MSYPDLHDTRLFRTGLSSLVIIFLLLGVGILPWTLSEGAALTMGPYDLAEWTSLRPETRERLIPLLTSLGYRVVILAAGWLILCEAVTFRRSLQHRVLMSMVISVMLTVAMLPPIEFFTAEGADANYRQQLLMSVAAFVSGVVIGLSSAQFKRRRFLKVVISILAFAAGALSLSDTSRLMREGKIPVNVGPGILLFCIGLALLVASELLCHRMKRGERNLIDQVVSPSRINPGLDR